VAIVRDYIARGHRTEARTELKDQSLRGLDVKPQEPQGGAMAKASGTGLVTPTF